VFGPKALTAEFALLTADVGWIMGGTGNPDPTPSYISEVEALFLTPPKELFPGQPTFDGYTFQGLYTPEQFFPVTPTLVTPTGESGLTFGQSLALGVTDLNNAITPQLAAGDEVAVFGYSQSATLTTIEMDDLIAHPPAGVDLSDLHVVLIGDPNDPLTGILERFYGAGTLPFLDVPLNGATPEVPFPTDIYTGEYDGWADFPQYPFNFLADANAIAGILIVHPSYPTMSPDLLGSAIDIGTVGDTTFYMIPEQLPILEPLDQIPYVGPVLGDAIAPELSVLIDWGYGNPGDPGGLGDGLAFGGAVGPWPIDLTASGVAGILPRLDPLQMLAALQYAEVQSLVGPVDDILSYAGAQPLPQPVTTVLEVLTGYDLTNAVDAVMRDALTGVSQLPGLADLSPDVLFNGAPIIDGTPIIDAVGAVFSIINAL
jgi:hypothetical protein